MSTTTMVDATEGWTFANNNSVPEVPTTTKPDNNWSMPPTAPSLPLSTVGQLHANNHASLH